MMAQISSQTRTPPTLLALPRELRDHIYDIVFQDQEPFEVIVSKHNHPRGKGTTRFLVSYTLSETAETHDAQHPPREMRWILANTQICEEAIEEFQRKATWELTNDATITEVVDMMAHQPSVYRGRTKRSKDHLIVPSAARNMVVRVPISVTAQLELDKREHPYWKLDMKGADIVLRLFSQRMGSSNLQTLSMTLHTKHLHHSFIDTPVRAEFCQLPPLDAPSLRKMVFRIEYLQGPGQGHFPPIADQDSTSFFEQAHNEVGMALIGGKGEMTRKVITTDSAWVVVFTYFRESDLGVKQGRNTSSSS